MESDSIIKPYMECEKSEIAKSLDRRIKKNGWTFTEDKQKTLLTSAIRTGDIHVIIRILQNNSKIKIPEDIITSFNLDNKPQYRGKFKDLWKDTKQKVETIQKFYERRQLELRLSKKLAQKIKDYKPYDSYDQFKDKQKYCTYINDIIILLEKGADYYEYDDEDEVDNTNDIHLNSIYMMDNLCIKIFKLDDKKLSEKVINFLINKNDVQMITELYNEKRISLREYNWLRRRSYLIFLSSLKVVKVHKIFYMYEIHRLVVSYL